MHKPLILFILVLVSLESTLGIENNNQENTFLGPITITEHLQYSTVRLEVIDGNNIHGYGTGFIFAFKDTGSNTIPVIITNKHVIKNARIGKFFLHEGILDSNEIKPSNSVVKVELDNFETRWILHPSKDVDLCAMFLQPLIVEAKTNLKKDIYADYLTENLIWTDEHLRNLSVVEPVIMVGYPIGLYDEKNNIPLFRQGVTSSHPANDFNGKSITVIDAACYPGSSGSPVILYEYGAYLDKDKGISFGSRTPLLGVLSSGPHYDSQGKIVIRDIPMIQQIMLSTPQMINLGYIVKAKEILVLGKEVKRIARRSIK